MNFKIPLKQCKKRQLKCTSDPEIHHLFQSLSDLERWSRHLHHERLLTHSRLVLLFSLDSAKVLQEQIEVSRLHLWNGTSLHSAENIKPFVKPWTPPNVAKRDNSPNFVPNPERYQFKGKEAREERMYGILGVED